MRARATRQGTGLWRLLAGFGVWASALIWIYAVNGVGCALEWNAAQRPALIAALAVHVLALLALIAPLRRGEGLMATAGFYCLCAALAATVLTFAPALALSNCVPGAG
jgi:hypothetical protein